MNLNSVIQCLESPDQEQTFNLSQLKEMKVVFNTAYDWDLVLASVYVVDGIINVDLEPEYAT